MGIMDKLKHAWNAFVSDEKDSKSRYYGSLGNSYSYRPDRAIFSRGNEKSIVTAVYNRIAIACSSINFNHARLDDSNRFLEVINSGLNNILTLEANKDQQARAFIQDIVISMFDEGVVAVVPIDTDVSIKEYGSFDIETMRTGRITQWYPDHVEVDVYNDRKGIRQRVVFPKKNVAIIENPHYAIMNHENSVLQRLIRKLNILDVIDEQSGSGKLDLIIQLPYIVKSETRKAQAEQRRQDIVKQLTDSKYGIAYTDGTEKITQLNRSVENNLLKQIEYLTSMLYSQLGMSEKILNGTADEKEMLNFNNGTIEPVVAAIALEFNRKFLTKTARTQKQKIVYFNDPFKFVPVANLAEIADKLTRNAILSANEIRQVIGYKPVDDPKADELRNNNLNKGDNETFANTKESVDENKMKVEENQNGK